MRSSKQDLASHELTFLNACGAGPSRAGPGRAGPGRAVRCRVILSWCGWVGDKIRGEKALRDAKVLRS